MKARAAPAKRRGAVRTRPETDVSNALSLSEIAEIAKVAISTVHAWSKEGLRTKLVGRERLATTRDVIAFLGNRRGYAADSQRERLAKEQADKVALENARRRGELVFAYQVEEVILAMSADLAQRHDALAGRVAGELAGLNDAGEVRTRLLDELREVRRSFAEAMGKLRPDSEDPRESGEDPDSSSET